MSITYQHHVVLNPAPQDPDERDPLGVREWANPIQWGTYDGNMNRAMEFIYRNEAFAAEHGTQVEFSFELETGQTSYRVGFQSGMSTRKEDVVLVITARLFVGLVLADRERNYYDDSDFYAVIWSPAKQKLFTHEFATTRAAGGGYARPDATPEIRKVAAQWMSEWYRKMAYKNSAADALKIKKGRFVKTVKAYRPRKADRIGFEAGEYAYVFWEGKDRFTGEQRFGIEFIRGEKSGERTFVNDERKFEIVNPADYERPAEDIEYHARRIAESPDPGFHQPFVPATMMVM